MEELTSPVGVVVRDHAAERVWRPVNERRTWRAAPSTRTLVWVFIGVLVVVLPALAVVLWVRGSDGLVAAALVALTVLGIGYAWRFGLHPRLTVAGTELEIRNPLRTQRVALDQVSGVEPGENGLRITAGDRVHEVWCVQTSSAALREHRPGRATQVITELTPYLTPTGRSAQATAAPEKAHRGDEEAPEHLPEQAAAPTPVGTATQTPPEPAIEDDDEPELLIHRATQADAETLTALEQRASAAALGHVFPPGDHPYPVADVTVRWAERLADRTVRVRIAEIDGEPVGYLAYRAELILHLGVAPDRQRHGYGRALMDYATRDIRREHDEVDLWVLRDHETARKFYREYGFVDTDQERPCEYPPRPVEMKMRLPAPR